MQEILLEYIGSVSYTHLLKLAVEEGVSDIILTPHYIYGSKYACNNKEKKKMCIRDRYQVTELQTAIDKINSKQQPDFTQTAPIIEWQENSTFTPTATISWSVARKEDVGSDLDYASELNETSAVVAVSYTHLSSL